MSSTVKAKKKRNIKSKKEQGIYGINANKSKILPVKISSDISTKVKSIIVKKD